MIRISTGPQRWRCNWQKTLVRSSPFWSIDDESRPYETVSLPFHDGNLVANVLNRDELQSKSSAELLAEAVERKIEASELRVRGHSASQVLLVSRFYDLVITSAEPWFTDEEQEATQRVNPLIEILDQAVVPVLMSGSRGSMEVNSAAVLFDGGPCATLALHALATLLSHRLDVPIHVRVSLIEERVARELAEDCEKFLRSKGYQNVIPEYSACAPKEAIDSGEFSRVDLMALGIRSRNTFHDLHVGVLARHLIENPQSGHTLFC